MYRKPWLEDLARRRVTSPEEAAARAHRGAALARAALAGKAVPPRPAEATVEPSEAAAHGRHEVVACARCYGPHDGLPNTRCPKCHQDDRQPGWPEVTTPGTG